MLQAYPRAAQPNHAERLRALVFFAPTRSRASAVAVVTCALLLASNVQGEAP